MSRVWLVFDEFFVIIISSCGVLTESSVLMKHEWDDWYRAKWKQSYWYWFLSFKMRDNFIYDFTNHYGIGDTNPAKGDLICF